MTLKTRVLGDGPRDLLFLHGWGLGSAAWVPTAAHFSAGYRCTLLDMPGYGPDAATVSDCSLTCLAESVLEVARPGSVLIGWSLGGMVALRAALEQSNRVRALCLVATTPRFTQGTGWNRALPPEVLEAFARDLEHDTGRTVGRFLTLQVRGTADSRPTLTQLRQAVRQAGHPATRVLQAGLEVLRVTDLRQDLARVQCPVCLILGERDALVPVALASACPPLPGSWWTEIISGAGHVPFLSHPVPFRAVLEGFLNALH
jgi:pimeloyl-[acyl-carrier protein] methyl ester esterase